MYNYGIGELNKKDVDHFTTDIGLKIRRVIDKPFKKACNVFTDANIIYDNDNGNMSDDEYFRQLNDEKIPASHYPLKDGKNNIVVLKYPKLNKDEPYIFLGNHTCPEDIETMLNVIDRNAYLILGSIESLKYNPEMYGSFINGMIPFDILDKKERKEVIPKSCRVLKTNSILMFPEGSHNYSPNKLINDLFDGPVNIAFKTNRKIVLSILIRDNEHNVSYIYVSDPIDITKIEVNMNKEFATEEERQKYMVQQLSLYLRDQMATAVYNIILKHIDGIKHDDYTDIFEYFKNQYVQDAFNKLKWNKDIFDAEYLIRKTQTQRDYEEVQQTLTKPKVLKESYSDLRQQVLNLVNLDKISVEKNMREHLFQQQTLKLTRKK